MRRNALIVAVSVLHAPFGALGFPMQQSILHRGKAIRATPPAGESREERLRRRELARQDSNSDADKASSEVGTLVAQIPCACRSGNYYGACCQPVHESLGKIATPEQLLRARYSAYVQGNTDFVIATTHETHPEFTPDLDAWRAELTGFIRSVEFLTFEIVSHGVVNATMEMLTWKAQMKVLPDLLSPEKVQTKEFTERSVFVREEDSEGGGDGRWFYAGGDEDFEPTNVLVKGPKPKRGPGDRGNGDKPKARPKLKARTVAARK